MSPGADPPPKVTAPAPDRGADDIDFTLSDPGLQILVGLREIVATDGRLLSPGCLRVLLFLLPELLDRRHRTVKQIALAKTLRMHQAHVSWVLRRLVQLGLLERGDNAPGAVRTYRVTDTLLFRFRYSQQARSAS